MIIRYNRRIGGTATSVAGFCFQSRLILRSARAGNADPQLGTQAANQPANRKTDGEQRSKQRGDTILPLPAGG